MKNNIKKIRQQKVGAGNPKAEQELAEIRKRVVELETAIKNFCDGQSHAVDPWKQQSHIKPLFDIAKDLPW